MQAALVGVEASNIACVSLALHAVLVDWHVIQAHAHKRFRVDHVEAASVGGGVTLEVPGADLVSACVW